MAGGFGPVPTFAASDDQTLSPALQAWIQDQQLQAQYAPQATPPGFTGYDAPAAPAAADPNRVLTPLGQKWAGDLTSVVTAPQRAYTGELQIWDPATGHTTEEARNAASGLAGLAMTGGFGGVGPGGVSLGAGPIRAYHGSPHDFEGAIRPSERGALGPGIYFTPAENIAQRYKGAEGKIYEADLGGDIFDGMKMQARADSSVNPYQVWRDQTARLVNAAEPEMKDRIAEIAGKTQPDDGYYFMRRLAQEYRDEGKAQDLFKRAGFDGISGHADGPEIAVFNPDVVNILRKYGLAGLLGGGAAAGALNQKQNGGGS